MGGWNAAIFQTLDALVVELENASFYKYVAKISLGVRWYKNLFFLTMGRVLKRPLKLKALDPHKSGPKVLKHTLHMKVYYISSWVDANTAFFLYKCNWTLDVAKTGIFSRRIRFCGTFFQFWGTYI